ncbi:MAG: methylmalonyl Co-A mutase-associated GTPase MeaB [Candidatus Kariarchaeaceae archaeon]|jgi:LAO/AO transport system kinase
MTAKNLLDNIREGDLRSLARAITHVENETSTGKEIVRNSRLYPTRSQIIGVTGSPGSGKSTLVNQLVTMISSDQKVAVLAVDPTSPFTGGAILGDRIRMLAQTDNQNVYIRSLASRGRLGGLSPHTFDVLGLMQLAGFDKIIVETVGAGQSEIDIMRNADTVIVVLVPGQGDDIQMIKAGIMEIADLFVINKSDLPESEPLMIRLKNALELSSSDILHSPTISLTSALNGDGIENLLDEIIAHYNYLLQDSNLETRRQEKIQVELMGKLFRHLLARQTDQTVITKLAQDLLNHQVSVGQALQLLENAYFTEEQE